MMEKMTIHRALSELKLIDSRIEKAITSLEPTGLIQEGKLVNGFYDRAEFEKSAKAKLQSVTDLIERKTRIKSAIVAVNGKTPVVIANKTMTISDAITFKTVIELKRNLIANLIAKHNAAKSQAEKNNTKVDEHALKLAEAALQKDNVQINDGDAVAITEPFIKKNKFNIVDPLEVEKLTDELQVEIDDFETEVDAVLSEINAITFIEI
jgi:hypothetical protein